MRASTQKLTTAAVCTALAVIMCAMCAYLPLSIMPLYMAAFCIFLAVKRGGVPHGVLCALATVGIMFAMTGLSVKWFFLVFMFAPYGLITPFVHRFNYFKVKSGIVRGLIAAAFFNLTFGFVYLIATRVATVGIDVPIGEWVGHLGGYWVLALVATVVLVPLDFIFSTLAIVVLKKIPAPVTRRKPQGGGPFDGSESGKTNDRVDDVFSDYPDDSSEKSAETDKPDTETPENNGNDKK